MRAMPFVLVAITCKAARVFQIAEALLDDSHAVTGS